MPTYIFYIPIKLHYFQKKIADNNINYRFHKTYYNIVKIHEDNMTTFLPQFLPETIGHC